MYQRTKIAGILFSVLYGVRLLSSGLLFLFEIVMFMMMGADADFSPQVFGLVELAEGIIVVFAIFIFLTLFFFFLMSIGFIRKASLSAKDYRKRLPGTIFFLVVQGFDVFSLVIFLGILNSIMSVIGSGANILIPTMVFRLIIIITGMVLIILDVVKSGKTAAQAALTDTIK